MQWIVRENMPPLMLSSPGTSFGSAETCRQLPVLNFVFFLAGFSHWTLLISDFHLTYAPAACKAMLHLSIRAFVWGSDLAISAFVCRYMKMFCALTGSVNFSCCLIIRLVRMGWRRLNLLWFGSIGILPQILWLHGALALIFIMSGNYDRLVYSICRG